MRHQKKRSKLGGSLGRQEALRRALITSFFMHGRIKTTQSKIEMLRPMVEKLITMAKTKEKRMASQAAQAVIYDKTAGQKLVNELSERYKDRNGGYTRIIKLGFRAGDSAPMAELQLV